MMLKNFALCILIYCAFYAPEATAQETAQETLQESKDGDATEGAAEKPEASSPKKRPEITAPKALVSLHNDDLTHYLPKEQVEQLLVGTESHMVIVKTQTSANQKGVVVLLPEWQQHAVSPQAIKYLSQHLPDLGWVTIALQPLDKPQNYPSIALNAIEQQEQNTKAIADYQAALQPYLSAALEKAQNYPGIIMLITEGHNAALVTQMIAKEAIPSPEALVMLSARAASNSTMEVIAKDIATSEIPILDLTLRADAPLIHHQAAIRQKLVNQLARSQYRQKQLFNLYSGYYPNEMLSKEITGWLKYSGW